jgi:hypothetical protein
VATVVVTDRARLDLDDLILTLSLPATTRDRVKAAIGALADFPLLGPALTGRWQGLRFILGPWPWMLLVYELDLATDQVSIVTIQDSRSARAATAQR